MIKRIITSIAILAFILPVLILGDSNFGGGEGQSFFLGMVGLLSFYAAYEINSFLLMDKMRSTIISSVITGVIINLVLLTYFGLMIYEMNNTTITIPISEAISPNSIWLWSLTPILFLPILFIFNKNNSKRLYQMILIVLYILWAFSILYINFVYGVAALFYPMIITVCVDTFAYFIGNLIGKHKIAPSISPNKTWEGTVGGIVVAILVGVLFGSFIVFKNGMEWVNNDKLNILVLFLITLLLSVLSFLGDLFFSFIKRKEGKKDYGTILPGHGGLLDRIDGHIFATSVSFILMVVIL